MPQTVKKDPLADKSAVWTDEYAITMSQALFANDKHNTITTFHAYIRKNPFDGGYLVTAGQNILLEWFKNWSFDADDIETLRRDMILDPVTGKENRLFSDAFLDMLKDAKLEVDIDMMPEGELAFPDEPIVRITGPAWQCLMLEAAILNCINSQSLFATLASRLREVAGTGHILEMGLRRAQMLGGLEASRAAYIGGIDGTSNRLAKKYYGIPTSGTMAHAMVMLYEDELQAFSDYAKALPQNTVFLVDTYSTLEGVKNAIKTCQDYKIAMKGIRLDSGDLAYLSKEARKLLDAAGFQDAKIAASNDLDEQTIRSLIEQGAKIDIWGIGTNLVTSKDQPALGAVYKLAAVYDHSLDMDAFSKLIAEKINSPHELKNKIRDVIKLSEQAIKISIPGALDVLRFMQKNKNGEWEFNGDMIYSLYDRDLLQKTSDEAYPYTLQIQVESVRKNDETQSKVFNAGTHVYRPLKPALRKGELICDIETVHQAKKRAEEQLKKLRSDHKRLLNPHIYVAGIEAELYERRRAQILNIRRPGRLKKRTG